MAAPAGFDSATTLILASFVELQKNMELPWTRVEITDEKIGRLFEANKEAIAALYLQLRQWEPPNEDLDKLRTLWARALVAVVQQEPIDTIWIALDDLAQVYKLFGKSVEKPSK